MEFKSPEIHRTPLYRAKAAYANMLRRCLNRCGDDPSYANVELKMTLEEWLEWSLPRYEEFQREFPDKTPNAARYGDEGHYELGNIHIVSHEENCAETRKHGVRPDGTKWCSGCKDYLPVGEFYKNKHRWDGIASNCKKCCAKYERRANGIPDDAPPRPTKEINHGTRAGYLMESYRKLPHCEACKEANRLYARRRYVE